MSLKKGKRLVVIGAGPVGIDAALVGAKNGYEVTVLERGAVGEHLRRWGHVRLFSPWNMNASEDMREALHEMGALPKWEADSLQTGLEYVKMVLETLARHKLLKNRVITGATVLGVSRKNALKNDFIGDPRRADRPFEILYLDRNGRERLVESDIVIDASGTFGHPNSLGSGGLHVPGELAAEKWIERGVPDVAGAAKRRYAGFRTLLVGSGHSACTTALGFRDLMEAAPKTKLLWVARDGGAQPFAPQADDPLASRAALLRAAGEFIAAAPRGLTYLGGSTIEAISRSGKALSVTVRTPAGPTRITVDRIISQVGFSPDNSIYRELQIHECYATFGPMKLSAAILGSAAGDCLDQTAHGVETLINPEADFFLLGAKSYGRNNTFLLRVGFEQVREVFSHLTRASQPEAAQA